MTDAIGVRSTAFTRNFAHYQDEAIRAKVIVVTSHDRVVGGYLSATELENDERLKAREQHVLIVGALDDDAMAQIEAAEYRVDAR